MSWDRSLYPDDWEEIAERVKERAGWRCENCGHPHSTEIAGRVLTVHHLDRDPHNCDDGNLLVCCQKCHLSIQARYRPGQLPLPGISTPAWMVERRLV